MSNISPVILTDGQIPPVRDTTGITMIGPIPLVAVIVMVNLFVFACIAICIRRYERIEAKKRQTLTNIHIAVAVAGTRSESWVAETKIKINESNPSSIPMTTIIDKPQSKSTLPSTSVSDHAPISPLPHCNIIIIETDTAPASPSTTATPVSSSPPLTP